MTVRVIVGDALDVLRTLDAASIDAVVTDPPYGLKFMGRRGIRSRLATLPCAGLPRWMP